MPESTNTYNDVQAADLLAQESKNQSLLKSGDSPVARTPQPIIGSPDLDEVVKIQDSVTVNGNIISVSDSVNVSDDAQVGGYTPPFKLMHSDTSDSDLMLFLKFNGSDNDSSGKGHSVDSSSGTFTYVAGRIKQALSFDSGDGSTASKTINHHSDLNWGTNGAHAVSFWILLKSAPGATRTIFCKGTGATGSRAPAISIDTSRQIVYMKSIGASTQQTTTASSALNVGEWYHVVCQFSTSIGMQIWLNASKIGDSPSNTTAMLTNTTSLKIGRGTSTLTTSPSMIIDDVRTWKRVLTQSEIENLYNNGLVGVSNTISPPARVGFMELAV